MKLELLDLLICPICGGEFELRRCLNDGNEIFEGGLNCKHCNMEFPITRGVPRMVAGSKDEPTAQRFGYEWKHFPRVSAVYEKQFLDWVSPIDRDFFAGKVVLDGGCGKGRHVRLAYEFGAATIIGVDVSEAIEVAYENTRGLPNVHLIQADIYHLPLKRAFDFVYSIGVLHHLPKPEEGFRILSHLLKPGGTISIWIYGREGNGWLVYCVNPIRRLITSRMPLPILKIMSLPVAFLIFVLCKLLYKPLNEHLKPLGRFLFYNEYLYYISNFHLREIHSIVFDHLLAPIAFYHRKDEVLSWIERSNLIGSNLSWHNKNSWRVMGKVK